MLLSRELSPRRNRSTECVPGPIPLWKTLWHRVPPWHGMKDSAWHGATVAPHATVAPPATVAGYAIVKGELRVPNTINFSVLPTLDSFTKAVYYQLFLLSHGFRKDTCLISLAKLSKSVLMSQRKVQDTIAYLEKRGLIKKLESKLGGPSRGNLYQVRMPAVGMAPDATGAQGATMAGDATLVGRFATRDYGGGRFRSGLGPTGTILLATMLGVLSLK